MWVSMFRLILSFCSICWLCRSSAREHSLTRSLCNIPGNPVTAGDDVWHSWLHIQRLDQSPGLLWLPSLHCPLSWWSRPTESDRLDPGGLAAVLWHWRASWLGQECLLQLLQCGCGLQRGVWCTIQLLQTQGGRGYQEQAMWIWCQKGLICKQHIFYYLFSIAIN